jgi:hypothetical protein
MDYKKLLDESPDATPEEKAELEKLSILQKDIAVSGSAEDFIRHPFFAYFEQHLNEVINDTKGDLLKVEEIIDLKVHKAKIEAIQEVKRWLNSKVMAGRIAQKAIEIYEEDTVSMNEKIQAAVDQSQIKS